MQDSATGQIKKRWRMRSGAFTALLLLLAYSANPEADALDGQCRKLDKSGGSAYAEGDYKKAESHWAKLLERLEEKAEKGRDKTEENTDLETVLRRLGECALKEKDYESAALFLKRATDTGANDDQLDQDCRELAANYRTVDLNNLGPIAKAAYSHFHPNSVTVSKLEKGHHVAICFPDAIIKDIGAKGVTQIGMEKNLSFDLVEGADGEITLANINGLKVHATVWVNIVNSSLKLDESAHPVALVTGRKLGFSQTVSTAVPDMIYLPLLGVVAQVKDMFDQQAAVVKEPIEPTVESSVELKTNATAIESKDNESSK